MRPYVVTVTKEIVQDVLIHAESEEEARELVEDGFGEEDLGEEQYSYTIENVNALDETAYAEDYDITVGDEEEDEEDDEEDGVRVDWSDIDAIDRLFKS